jgi:hypothetical protein
MRPTQALRVAFCAVVLCAFALAQERTIQLFRFQFARRFGNRSHQLEIELRVDPWMHFGLSANPQYVALARVFVNDELWVLLRCNAIGPAHDPPCGRAVKSLCSAPMSVL